MSPFSPPEVGGIPVEAGGGVLTAAPTPLGGGVDGGGGGGLSAAIRTRLPRALGGSAPPVGGEGKRHTPPQILFSCGVFLYS